MDEREKAFMEELTELSKKYGFWLCGSDCCGCSSATFYDFDAKRTIDVVHKDEHGENRHYQADARSY